MDNKGMITRTGGYWERDAYEGGMTDYIILTPTFTYDDLLRSVGGLIGKNDADNLKFELRSLISTKGGRNVRFPISSEREWKHLLSVSPDDEEIQIFVSVERQHSTQVFAPPVVYPPLAYPSPPFIPPPNFVQPSNKYLDSMNQSFVDLINQQGAPTPLATDIHQPASMAYQGMRCEKDNEQITGTVVEGCSHDFQEKSFSSANEGFDGHYTGQSSEDDSDDDLFQLNDTHIDVEMGDVYTEQRAEDLDNDISKDFLCSSGSQITERTEYNCQVSTVPLLNQSPTRLLPEENDDQNCDDDIGEKNTHPLPATFPDFSSYSILEIPTIISSSTDHELHVGALFTSKKKMIISLGKYVLKEKFEFRAERSSTTRYEARCKVKGCKFVLKAKGISGGDYWKVTKLMKEHTCQLDVGSTEGRQVQGKIIAELIGPSVLDNGRLIRPCDLMKDLKRKYGVDVLYTKAWRAKELAQRNILGDAETSYQLLPSYLYMIEKMNPGSIVNLQTDDLNRFEYLFMALGPSVSGFQAFARPVVVLDATFLKGRMKGTMFIASTLDGNDQIYPLAFGIGDAENDRAWLWFLTEFRAVVGTPLPLDLIFISDRHKSIQKAVKNVFPSTIHGVCWYHLKQNLRVHRNEHLLEIFDKMTTVYTMKECSDLVPKLMEVDKGVTKKAYNTLIHDVTLRRWTRSYCPVRRYNFMTSNIAESLNSALRHARKFPVCPLLECIREMLQRWFFERKEKANGRSQVLTESVTSQVNKDIDDAAFIVVAPIGNGSFQVKVGDKSHNVNLHEKTCTCRRFDLDQIPCGHAIAAIRNLKLDIHGFCADYSKTENLRQLYSGCIYPVGHPDDWSIPPKIKSRVVLPPITRVPPGKPKGKRVPSGGERRKGHQKLQVCSRCKKLGHKRVTCTSSIGTPANEHVCESSDGPSKNKRTRHCSTCGEIGHNKKTCPTPQRYVLRDEVDHDLFN